MLFFNLNVCMFIGLSVINVCILRQSVVFLGGGWETVTCEWCAYRALPLKL